MEKEILYPKFDYPLLRGTLIALITQVRKNDKYQQWFTVMKVVHKYPLDLNIDPDEEYKNYLKINKIKEENG